MENRRFHRWIGLLAIAGLLLAAAAEAAPRLRAIKAPALSGKASAGETLRVARGTWTPRPTRFAYRWLRCDARGARCARVKDASGSRYTLTDADAGHRLRAEVIARRGARRASRRTAATGLVAARPRTAPPAQFAPAPLPLPLPEATPTATATASPQPTVTATPTPDPPRELRVVGNKLMDGDQVVRLRGVNYAGPEYACVQGWGIFDGPEFETVPTWALDVMRTWKINAVRVPLNEHCWLGINNVNPRYGGATYRAAIRDLVSKLHARGMYVELSLMWAAPGTETADYQPNAANADHSPDMWRSLAAEYKDVADVILAPWGETTVNWACHRDGCADQATFRGKLYQSAGMQQAVTVMREAGYTGPIAIPGIEYANNLSRWLEFKPADPLNQLVAEAHLYGKNACDTTACLDATYGPVAAQVPLLYGEVGNTYDDSECGTTHYIERFLDWADAHGASYLAWTWNIWNACGALLDNFDGTPNGAYGAYVKAHLGTNP